MEVLTAGLRRTAQRSANWSEKRQLQGLGDELDAFSEEELQRRPEVRMINKYAVVMAYVRIGLKGIGALALLWATVVLLGGFVSDLTKKDFWYLTIIAFVQAAGLSDAMGDARLVFFQDWTISLIDSESSISLGERLKREIHTLPLKIIDLTLFFIFAPVVYFALSGPILCITLSALRVAKQDYGIADGDASKANLKPALTLYYCVSLAHGAICLLCMIIESIAEEGLAEILSRHHGLSPEVLDGYLHETMQMCVNSPASTQSWNLITYGAGLLDSQLPEDYASGGRVLNMLIDQGIPVSITQLLIRSPRQRIQKLIGTLAWRSPAEREMRWLAARIVEHLAGHLNLAQFPGALECISSLLDTSCHNNGDQEALCLPFVIGRSKPRKRRSFLRGGFTEKHKDGNPKDPMQITIHIFLEWIYRKYCAPTNHGTLERDIKRRENGEGIDENLVLPGLKILENLAHDRHNCALIYNNKDLLSKLVAPVSSDQLVEDIKSNAAWTKVVEGSLKVVSRLMGSPGSTGEVMRSLIAGDSNVVKNMVTILDSNISTIELQMQAIEVLIQLSLHHPASTSAAERGEKLIKRALHIFLAADWMEDYLKDDRRKIVNPTTSQQTILPGESMRICVVDQESVSRLKEKAGEALATLSSDSEAIKSFTTHDDDVHRLTELLDSNIKTIKCDVSATNAVEIDINIGCRISAAVILKHLSNYDKETTLQKVLAELLPAREAEAISHPGCWEGLISIYCRNDTENPTDGGKNELSASQSHHIQQCGERRLQAELLSLVAAIRPTNNLDFAEVLISQLQPDALEKLGVRLKKIVEDNMYATPACLAIQKLTCKMITDVLRHDEIVKVINDHKIIDTLLEASKAMAGLESSMLFAGVRHDSHGVPLKPLSSVLAKNAEDLLTQRKQALGINVAPVSSLP